MGLAEKCVTCILKRVELTSQSERRVRCCRDCPLRFCPLKAAGLVCSGPGSKDGVTIPSHRMEQQISVSAAVWEAEL